MKTENENKKFNSFDYHESLLKEIIEDYFSKSGANTTIGIINELLNDHLNNKDLDLKKQQIQEIVCQINELTQFISSLNERRLILKLIETEN